MMRIVNVVTALLLCREKIPRWSIARLVVVLCARDLGSVVASLHKIEQPQNDHRGWAE